MKSFLTEIIELFRKEKLYSLLLSLIFIFYITVFFIHKTETKKNHVHNKNRQQIEALLRAAPQKAEIIEKRLSKRPVLWWMTQIFTYFFVCAFGIGVWLGSSDLKRLFSKQELIPASGQSLSISWGAAEIVKAIVLFFSFGILFNLFLSFLKFVFFRRADTSWLIIFHTSILDITTVFVMIFLIKKSGARLWDLFGFTFRKIPFREIWLGIRTYCVVLPVFMVILFVLIFVANRMSYEPPPHPLVEVLLKDQTTPPWIVMYSLFVACIVGPIVEEIFFRGFFYPALRKYLGIGWTMMVTAVFFAVVHENIFSFLPILFLGFVLCYLYEKRSGLLACITLHMIHNAAFLVYFFLMKNILFGQGGT